MHAAPSVVYAFTCTVYDEGFKVREHGLGELYTRLDGSHYFGALPGIVGEGRTLVVGFEAHVFNIGGGFTRLTSVNPTPQSVSEPT